MDTLNAFSVSRLVDRVVEYGGQKTFGWQILDRRGLGVNPGDLAVVAGRTGHGKSTVLFNLLLHWLEAYPNELFILFSYEMPPESVFLKLLSPLIRKQGASEWSYHDIRRWMQEGDDHKPTHGDVDDLKRAIETLKSWEDRLTIVYQPDWTVDELAEYARELASGAKKIGGILVDYLQLVGPPPGAHDTLVAGVAAVAKNLKRLGVSLDCPIVAAAQVSREAARLTDWVPDGTLEDFKVLKAIAKRRPQLHHLRDGGGEQEADLVIGLLNYRADYIAACEEADDDRAVNAQNEDAGPFDVTILKNRHGELGKAPLIFESKMGFIRDTGVFGR